MLVDVGAGAHITDCVFQHNTEVTSAQVAAGIGAQTITVINSTFFNNTSPNSGAAIKLGSNQVGMVHDAYCFTFMVVCWFCVVK